MLISILDTVTDITFSLHLAAQRLRLALRARCLRRRILDRLDRLG